MEDQGKALLSFDLEALDRPLKKGGREGILGKPFS
jgi:hypothetical protein